MHAHTDTKNYKHTHTLPHKYNHGEDLILITNRYVFIFIHTIKLTSAITVGKAYIAKIHLLQ